MFIVLIVFLTSIIVFQLHICAKKKDLATLLEESKKCIHIENANINIATDAPQASSNDIDVDKDTSFNNALNYLKPCEIDIHEIDYYA